MDFKCNIIISSPCISCCFNASKGSIFNYRKTPAVQLAKKYIEEGAIGEILDFRGTYLQDWSADPESPLSWRFQKNICGSGALGDIGTHVVDMLRFLVGDFKKVNARTATYIPDQLTNPVNKFL